MSRPPKRRGAKAEAARFPEIDLTGLKTYRMADLERKVGQEAFAAPGRAGMTVAEFARSLPRILAAQDLLTFAELFARAWADRRAVVIMFGGHVVKTGMNPLLIDWMERGAVSALATHGAAAIHDTEVALFGRTSEDVAAGLADGSFGMSRDTADFINGAVAHPRRRKLGFGEALAQALTEVRAPFADRSLLCAALRFGVPLTVHVALGTDIVHQHLSADGASIGRASLRDFRIFAAQVARLTEGSVVMNWGSAVIMPEVFLKALSVARNLGASAHGFVAANFDMFTHYRPTQNVLVRPTLTGGRRFAFIGHHELMLPLLHALVDEFRARNLSGCEPAASGAKGEDAGKGNLRRR